MWGCHERCCRSCGGYPGILRGDSCLPVLCVSVLCLLVASVCFAYVEPDLGLPWWVAAVAAIAVFTTTSPATVPTNTGGSYQPHLQLTSVNQVVVLTGACNVNAKLVHNRLCAMMKNGVF